MDAKHRHAIRRGIKRMQKRRRMSDAMKASWARRRQATLNSTLAVDVAVTDDNIVEAAFTILGREKVRDILTTMIKESL
jgi:hypothetical protein